jgi:hypothetical protein
MMKSYLSFAFLSLGLFAASLVAAQETVLIGIANWAAPAFWSPPRAAHGVTTQGDITSPLPFIGVTPCRQYDSRNTTALPQNTAREVVITGAPCGIPSGAAAASLNVTVFDILGQTGNAVFQVGTTSNPTTAWINYPIGQGQIGNAGALPLSGAGSIFFRVQQGAGSIDFTIDVNGYYASTPATLGNYFSVVNSGLYAIYGQTNNSTLNATGVYGKATLGTTNGVWGDNTSSSPFATGVFGVAEATTGATTGVWGRTKSQTDGARGVVGETTATSGNVYGVQGVTGSLSIGSAGVYGVDGSDPSTGTGGSAGVRGASAVGFGVLGFSSYRGVEGVLVDSMGLPVTLGILGYNNFIGVYSFGDVYAAGNVYANGAKPFVDPHPTDATKEVVYVALEGPEAGTYFRGRGRIHNGTGVIMVPESFRLVSDEEGLTVQITPIGQSATVAVVSFDLNSVVVRSPIRDLEFFYVVNGVRKAFKDWEAIAENKHYVPEGPEARMPRAFAPEQRRRLIATGIYNEDGTVNLETAKRLGWAQAWRDREEQTKAAAAAYRATRAARMEEEK